MLLAPMIFKFKEVTAFVSDASKLCPANTEVGVELTLVKPRSLGSFRLEERILLEHVSPLVTHGTRIVPTYQVFG